MSSFRSQPSRPWKPFANTTTGGLYGLKPEGLSETYGGMPGDGSEKIAIPSTGASSAEGRTGDSALAVGLRHGFGQFNPSLHPDAYKHSSFGLAEQAALGTQKVQQAVNQGQQNMAGAQAKTAVANSEFRHNQPFSGGAATPNPFENNLIAQHQARQVGPQMASPTFPQPNSRGRIETNPDMQGVSMQGQTASVASEAPGQGAAGVPPNNVPTVFDRLADQSGRPATSAMTQPQLAAEEATYPSYAQGRAARMAAMPPNLNPVAGPGVAPDVAANNRRVMQAHADQLGPKPGSKLANQFAGMGPIKPMAVAPNHPIAPLIAGLPPRAQTLALSAYNAGNRLGGPEMGMRHADEVVQHHEADAQAKEEHTANMRGMNAQIEKIQLQNSPEYRHQELVSNIIHDNPNMPLDRADAMARQMANSRPGPKPSGPGAPNPGIPGNALVPGGQPPVAPVEAEADPFAGKPDTAMATAERLIPPGSNLIQSMGNLENFPGGSDPTGVLGQSALKPIASHPEFKSLITPVPTSKFVRESHWLNRVLLNALQGGGFHDPIPQEEARAHAAARYYQSAKIPMPQPPQNMPEGYAEWLSRKTSEGLGNAAEGAGRAIRFMQAPGL